MSDIVVHLRNRTGRDTFSFGQVCDEAAKEIEWLRAEVEALRAECDRAWKEVDYISKDRRLFMARLDEMVKCVADVIALQPPKPVVIEMPHGPVSDQLMQKFYGAKR